MKKHLLLASFCSALLVAGCNQAADTAATVPSPDAGTAANTAQEQPEMDEDTLLTALDAEHREIDLLGFTAANRWWLDRYPRLAAELADRWEPVIDGHELVLFRPHREEP